MDKMPQSSVINANFLLKTSSYMELLIKVSS